MVVKEQTAYRPVPPRTHASTTESRTVQRSGGAPHDTEDDELPRLPVVVRRYNHPVMRLVVHDKRQHKQALTLPSTPRLQPRHQRQYHPLTYIGLGTVIPIALFLAILLLVNWWSGYQVDQRYGMPRTYQVDVTVGHEDEITPSHFIAVNLKGRIIVTEFPGGDPSKAIVYTGPVLLRGEEKVPVTLDFRDVNGDRKLDMLILVGTTPLPFLNVGDRFRTVRPEDRIHP